MAIGDIVTAERVKAIRQRTGQGMMEIKRDMMRNEAIIAVESFRQTGDRETLADILKYLVERGLT